ncbi:hypothetical protein [Spirosoma jeollabukense]
MKKLVTYLTMFVLFIIGARLVTAQQNYARSRQELAPVAPETLPFQQYLRLISQSMKETNHNARPTTDTAIADAASDEHTIDKSLNRQTTGTWMTTVRNRKSVER